MGIRVGKIDSMISELENLARIDGESERLKEYAIQYLKSYADYLDCSGIKTIKEKCPGAATPDGHIVK